MEQHCVWEVYWDGKYEIMLIVLFYLHVPVHVKSINIVLEMACHIYRSLNGNFSYAVDKCIDRSVRELGLYKASCPSMKICIKKILFSFLDTVYSKCHSTFDRSVR